MNNVTIYQPAPRTHPGRELLGSLARRPATWAALITLLGFGLRVWALESFPPGWRDDELIESLVISRNILGGDLAAGDVRPIARLLRESPEMTVAAATRLLAATAEDDDRRPTADNQSPTDESAPIAEDAFAPLHPRSPAPLLSSDPLRPARVGAPTSIERLDWVRGHLARVDRQGLTAAERKELLRLLKLIKEDVTSLMAALTDARPDDF